MGAADKPESRSHPKAEFHDIGKLIDWVAVGLHPPETSDEPHEFERCVETDEARRKWGVQLEGNAAWRNIVRKDGFHKLRTEAWPDSLDWLFTSHADNLAAGFGRAINELQINAPPRQGIHCLWTGKDWDGEARQPSEAPGDPRLKDEESLREMIEFLNSDPTWEEAEEKYAALLRWRAETARPGLNVTTLLSHCRTVGKLARVLSRLEWKTKPDGLWRGSNGGESEGGSQNLISARYVISFPHEPYRARDMTIFSKLDELMNDLETGEFRDNVLSRFDSQVVAAFESTERKEEFEQAVLKQRFRLRGTVRSQQIRKNRKASLGSFFEPEVWIFPPDLPDRIEEPICEVCKMARATKNWLTDAPEHADEDAAEIGREDLCEDCYQLRKEAPKLQKLADDWREGALVWIHFRLDFERLRAALKRLAQAYLREVPWKEDKGANKDAVVESLDVSLPVIVDFVEDYKKFLSAVRERLEREAREQNLEKLMDNLLVVRLSEVGPLEILKICLEELRAAFPMLCAEELADTFPLRVALSASNVKHPFFQHWRFLQATEFDVEFQLVNSGRARFKVAHADGVLASVVNVSNDQASSLHALAAMSALYPSLGQLAILDKTQRGLRLEQIAQLVENGKIDLESVRVLANLASRFTTDGGDNGQVHE